MKSSAPAAAPASLTLPPEWAPQACIWTAWPSHPGLWEDNLAPARREVAAMIEALADAGRVHVLVMGDEAAEAAGRALPSPNVTLHPAQFGDIWLRDTGPVFARDAEGRKVALAFRFNGWGGKYELPYDDTVAAFIARQSRAALRPHDFVLEGGAIEHDGAGTLLTTRECLLNPNRNPGMSEAEVAARVKEMFGAKRLVWLDRGLANDHTDGHIDNLARFAAPGHVLCQSPAGPDDPNAEALDDVARTLAIEGFRVTRIPGAGLVKGEDGEAAAASHMNYVIFNGVIVVPSYDPARGAAAAAALEKAFPGHRAVALPARHVLTGGGSFHCITQQEFA